MARALHPKHCTVHAIELDGRGGATVRIACSTGGIGGQVQYSSRKVKASSVRFRGLHVEGNARVGFVTSPAVAVCRKDGREIACRLEGDRSSASLQGLQARRRRR